jgi:nucleoside-diphosphate-sugar epimerase
VEIVIAGGAGFIGSHLVDRHLAAGDRVVVIDNLVSGSLGNLPAHGNLSLLQVDLAMAGLGDIPLGRIDAIYNFAAIASPVGYARRPLETLAVNAAGTGLLLDLAHKHGARFLQASTSEIYGDPLVHPQPETYWGNVNPTGARACYVEGKRFAEALIMQHVRSRDLDARIARIFNTYGPRSLPDDGRVVPAFCMQALRGEPLSVFGSGGQTRSFCYVDDLVEGLWRLMRGDDLHGEIVNIGNPTEISMSAFARLVVELTGSQSDIVHSPLPQDDPQRRCPDIAKARRLLDWEPKTPLSEGLSETINWFRSIT